MADIPAGTTQAAWEVAHTLRELLGWAIQPCPEPLPVGWDDAYRKKIRDVFYWALLSFEGDTDACTLLRDTLELAERFVALLASDKTLAATPVQDWPIKTYQRMFDDLGDAEREFRMRCDAADSSPLPEAAKTDSHPLGHPKIILPTDPDVCEVWNAIQATTSGTPNVSKICLKVAEKAGVNAESLRKKFNRWKNKNIG